MNDETAKGPGNADVFGDIRRAQTEFVSGLFGQLGNAAATPPDRLPDAGIDLREHIAQIELNLIRDALDRAGGVVAHAAQLLGLRRTTLVEKLRKYGVEREDVALATEN